MLKTARLVPTRLGLLFVLVGGLLGCGETLDADDLAALPSIEGYATWTMQEAQGFAPGHGMSYRRIFVNAVALQQTLRDPFPVGSVIVKEIFADDAAREPRYLAIMRRPSVAPPGLSLDGGWLFTTRDSSGSEKRGATCYPTCHQQGAHDGVFLRYSGAP